MEQGTVAGIGWFEPFATMLSPVVMNPSVPEYWSSLQRPVLQLVPFY
jgi:hypothetical protein